MVTVLKGNKQPSTAERFANAFGNLGQSASTELSNFYENSKEKPKKDVFPTIRSVLRSSDRQLSNDQLRKVYQKANQYRDLGLDDFMASSLALEDLEKGSLEGFESAEEMDTVAQLRGEKPKKNIVEQHHQGLQGFNHQKTPIETLEYKDLFKLSEEQLQALPRDQKLEYFSRIRELAPGAVGHGILSDLTLGGYDKLTQNLAPEFSEKSLAQEGAGIAIGAGGVIGSTVPLSQGFKIGSKILNFFGKNTKAARAATSALIFGGHRAIEEKIKNGEVEPGDVALSALFGGAGSLAFESIQPYLTKLAKKVKFTEPKFGARQGSEAAKRNLLIDYAVKEADAAGVSIQKVAAGDPTELQKFNQVLSEVSKLPPSVLNEQITRLFNDTNLKNITRRAQVLEDQINYSKRTKRLGEEIAEEEGRIAERDRPVAKREATIAKENALIMEAEKELPAALKRFNSVTKELGKAKDTFSYLRKTEAPLPELEAAKNVIDRLQLLHEDANEIVKALNYQKNRGKAYKSDRELQLEAVNDVANLEHKVKTRPEGEILKPDSRQEYIEKIKGRREIPGTEMLPEDTHTRLFKTRAQEHENKIKDLKQKRYNAHPSELSNIEKSIDVAEKLLQQNKDYLKVHERRRALQDISKTLKRQEKLKAAEKVQEDKRIRDAIKSVLKDPSEKNIKKASEALYGKEESKKVDETIDEMVLKADEILKAEGTDAAKESKFEEAVKDEVEDLLSKIKEKRGAKEKASSKSKESPFSNTPHGSRENQKKYVNYLNFLSKLFKKIRPAVRFYKKHRTIINTVLVGSGLYLPSPRDAFKYAQDWYLSDKFSKTPDHKKPAYYSELKNKYGPKRAKRIQRWAS